MPSDSPADLDRLLGDAVAAQAPVGPCPDDNALGALAEGRVTERERDTLVDHIASCSSCRDVARALIGADLATRAPARVVAFPRWAYAAAAALVVAAGAGIYLATRPSSEPTPTAVALASAGDRLARQFPAAFGGFRPLDATELSERVAEPTRGDGGIVTPAGRTLSLRPTFRWDAVPGARSYTVTVIDAAGTQWSRKTSETSLAWPADVSVLAPGARVAWSLAADDPHATHLERAIEVASAGDAKIWGDVVSAASSVEPPLRSLVLAHAALRRGLAGEAVEHAREFLAARPGDALGEATLAACRDRLAAR